MVRASLDVLLPALPRRLPQGDAKHPIWIRYTKKILVEEGHATAHLAYLAHLYRTLARHPALFAPSAGQFVLQMAASLSRLALPATSTTENRALALDLAWLILHWERDRRAVGAVGAPAGGTQAAAAQQEGRRRRRR